MQLNRNKKHKTRNFKGERRKKEGTNEQMEGRGEGAQRCYIFFLPYKVFLALLQSGQVFAGFTYIHALGNFLRYTY